MKFPGKCAVCRRPVAAGEVAFWAKGLGVKHEACSSAAGMACMACGAPAGCDGCELRGACDPPSVSQACLCAKCLAGEDAHGAYQAGALKRFPQLNLKI